MKIGYLLSRFPAANHSFMLSEIASLRQLGFDVSVASISNPDRPLDKLTAEERAACQATFYVKAAGVAGALKANGKVFLTRPVSYVRGALFAIGLGDWSVRKTVSSLFYFVEAVMAGEWMLRQGVRHIHTHYSSTVALIVTRLFPVTMSMTIHGIGEFDDPAGFRLNQKVKASRFVVAICYWTRSQVMRWSEYEHWSKLEDAPIGIDASVFTPRPFRAQPAVFRLVCAAQLVPLKGQHVLIATAEILVKAGRKVAFHLAGGGPDRPDLEREVEARGLREHVIFEGLMNRDQLLDLYRQSDAMVLPSFADACPVSLMEAMAMEIPCVGTWVCGVPELIESGASGLLVPPADPQALADAIARLMDDPEFRHKIGLASRPKILEMRDLKNSSAKLAAVFARRLKVM